MSYFDHVRCHTCRASLDPEEIGPQGMTCPKCGTQLSLTDLFGVQASFAEDDLPNLGLDDLVGKVAQPGADWRPPPPPPKKARPADAAPTAPRAAAGRAPIRPSVLPPAQPPAQPARSEAPRVRSIGLSSPGAPPPPPPAKPADRALVATPKAPEPEPEPEPPTPAARRIPGKTSAADLMRALKKKK